MKTSLTQFLTDMRDSDNIVGVKESQLRNYARQFQEWEKLAENQSKTINELLKKIEKLEDDIELYKIENRSLKNNKIEIIDLYA